MRADEGEAYATEQLPRKSRMLLQDDMMTEQDREEGRAMREVQEMGKWYIDKIKAVAPELLDGDRYDIMYWIDDAFLVYAKDEDTAAAMEDSIKEQEEYYGVETYYMSRTQLLTVAAKIMSATEGTQC